MTYAKLTWLQKNMYEEVDLVLWSYEEGDLVLWSFEEVDLVL